MKPRAAAPAADVAPAHAASGSLLELVLSRVRLRARRRAAWLAHLARGSSSEPQSLDSTFAICLDGRDRPAAEMEWYDRADAIQPLNEELEQVERALAGDLGGRLRQLGDLFGLNSGEMDLLQTCLATAVDPTLASVYAYLQQHPARGYATESLAARLFDHGRGSLTQSGGPLVTWGLICAGESDPGEPRPLTVDPLIVEWLQGELRLDPALIGRIQIVEPRDPLESWPVEETAQVLRRAIERQSAIRILLMGPPASGRRTFAAAIAAHIGVQTIAVDTTGTTEVAWPDIYMRAQRLAALGSMALVWHGGELQRPWPGTIAPAPIQFVACDFGQRTPPCAHVIDHRINMAVPTLDERRKLWKTAVPEAAAWPAKELEALIARFRLNAGDIVQIGGRAPASVGEAADFARELTRHRLGELARMLDCPFCWNDLVVPPRLRGALEDFAFEARDRTTFWDSPNARRLFPRGTGLVALFNGSPGTGKTMAAQVIAADLELDLFRVDLATVVSKYIGETAKHLAQIFARASRMDGVLLFDEADALFSKRTGVKDSHDRYANTDTSYLLQLIEDHSGIIILATNKKQNIDPAFVRRVRYMFDFPRPDAADRGRIWRQVIGELAGEKTLNRLLPAIERLAGSVDLSGAQIKNAVLASIFVARRNREPLAMAHLLRGVERELGKDGRALSAHESERLIHDV